ncbi:MAG: hypothetical protein NVS9B15_15970 [Acidobacteriaceae bacterium]
MNNRRRKPMSPNDSGAALVEFALSFTVLMFLIFWIFELSTMMYCYVVVGEAAKEGVRYAIVHGLASGSCSGPSTGCADSSGANVITVVKSYAANSLHDTSAITVQANYLDSSSASPSRIQVKVAYTYIPYIKFSWIAPTLVASAEGRIVY